MRSSRDPKTITRLLRAASEGERRALDELIPIVYSELREMAGRRMRRERPGHTLGATGLLHEALLRLSQQAGTEWVSRDQYFAVCALTMRRVLVDWARSKGREKRSGEIVALHDDLLSDVTVGLEPEEVLSIDAALENLAAVSPRAAAVVAQRYFGGLSVEESATSLGISSATVKRDWRFAKTWLRRELEPLGRAG